MNGLSPVSAAACCASCAPDSSQATALAIACALGARDFKERVGGIRELARRSLIRSERTSLQLSLTYSPDALVEVSDLVARESQCCAFLAFEMNEDDRGVHLTITAPVDALRAADELFDHFAPQLARVAA